MTILRPVESRLTGTWTVNGAASAHEALADPTEATSIETDEVGTASIAFRFGGGGTPEEGDFGFAARVEHNGNPQQSTEVSIYFYNGDPDAGGNLALIGYQDVGVPRNAQNASRNLTGPQQRALQNADDLWVVVSVGRNDGGFTFYWVELDVPDDPVGTWNSDLSACPVDTLVWFQMSDGRARQGRLLSGGEFDDGAGNAIELDQHNFAQDADGKLPASRAVIAWGSI